MRGPILTALGLLAVVLAVLGAATRAYGGNISSDLSRARSAVGVPAAPPDAAVTAAAAALLKGKDPGTAFSDAGGSGDLVAAIVPAGSALSTAELKRIVFDPRVTALAGSRAGRKVAVAGTLDETLPFARPVLAGATVDPGIAGSIALLFPPGTETIPRVVLTERRGGATVSPGVVATATQGLAGAILVQLKGRDRVTGPQIGYGLRYRLTAGPSSFVLRTRPLPPVLRSASFAPGEGFRGADRARFLREIRRLPPAARRIARYVGGAVTIRVLDNSASVCGEQTSCAGYDPGNGYFMLLNRGQLHSEFGRFVIAHEFGHLVDFLGLDAFSYDGFHDLFERSPKWKTCFSFEGRCTPFAEVFADQFAGYGLRARTIPTGYNDPVLTDGGSFGSLLDSQWAFRPPQVRNPLAGFGPLASTFTAALGSGGSGL
jgi:hypothetical protein